MTSLDPDSVRAVARKDFEDALRSRALLVLAGVFVVFFLAAAYFFTDSIGQAVQQGGQNAPPITSSSFLRELTNVTRLLVPLTGAVVAYASVVDERESGSLKLLLSLPHSRLDVLVGKLLGRGAVLALPVALGLLIAVPTFPLAGIDFIATDYLLFSALTVLVGLTFVAIGLGASAAADSSRRAVVATFVPYVVFTLLWGQVARRITSTLRDRLDLGQQAVLEAFFGARALNPIAAYQMVASTVGSPQAQLSLFSPPTRQSYVRQFGELPWYLSDGALVGVLLLWVVVPVAVGYLVFESADL
ncbi:ABC transporter permease [Halosegnis sp.]|uniref:ABC transporter permease n=1 Tax=Halosegnis sp. TaxID=2864959 RepID=UPI0035D509E7